MPITKVKAPKRPPKIHAPSGTHVAIIGAGRGGTALIEIFATDPLVQVVGVAEVGAQVRRPVDRVGLDAFEPAGDLHGYVSVAPGATST